MQIVHARDLLTTSQRTITAEGFMVAPGRLARVGVQRYKARELMGEDGQPVLPHKNPDDVVNVYRPAAEVLSKDAVSSFENRPITLGHPDMSRYPQGVTADTWRELAVGHVNDCRAKDGYMEGMLYVTDRKAIDAVMTGTSQLSNGYSFELDPTPGVTESGEAYDCIQRNVRGNHVAVVDFARGGPGCRIADHQEDKPMKRTVTVDGVSYQLEEGEASLVEKLEKERNEARTTLKTKTADHEAAVAKLTEEHGKVVAELKKQVVTPEQLKTLVADRSTVLAECAKHCPDVKPEELETLSIRRAMVADLVAKNAQVKLVVDATLAGAPLDKAEQSSVEAAYRVAMASVKTQVNDGDKVSKHLAAPTSSVYDGKKQQDNSAGPQEFTPEANVAAMSGAWRGAK